MRLVGQTLSHLRRTRVPDLICPLPRRKTRKRHPLSLPLPDHPDGTGPPPHPHDDNIRTVQYKTCKLTNSAPNHTHRLPDETNCCSSGTSHGGDRVSFIRKPNHHSVIIAHTDDGRPPILVKVTREHPCPPYLHWSEPGEPPCPIPQHRNYRLHTPFLCRGCRQTVPRPLYSRETRTAYPARSGADPPHPRSVPPGSKTPFSFLIPNHRHLPAAKHTTRTNPCIFYCVSSS